MSEPVSTQANGGSFAYTKLFDPPHVARRTGRGTGDAADLRNDPVYVYNDEIVLAVNVALATRRPILVAGPSGTGKSSLARSVAEQLRWRYYEEVVTSRTQARDLLWRVDLLRRLRDAQARGNVGDQTPYLEPGVLWWAFDAEQAARRGADPRSSVAPSLSDPSPRSAERAVVLLDEIDKADPDVPNNLLVPLGSLEFRVEETGARVATSPDRAPLLVITTNKERALPAAFLRRCVELEFPAPTRSRLLEIARAHFPKQRAKIERIAEALFGPVDPSSADKPLDVSPAEFLDTVRACETLELEPTGAAWEALSRSTVWKFGRSAAGAKKA